MHFQREPYQEEKLVQCIKGRIYDVIVDLREDSDTYLKWIGIELTETNNKSLYIPKGFAHGFQVLEDDSVVLYNMGQFYREEAASGIHYASPSIAIQWPLIDVITSLKDEQLKKI